MKFAAWILLAFVPTAASALDLAAYDGNLPRYTIGDDGFRIQVRADGNVVIGGGTGVAMFVDIDQLEFIKEK